MPIKTKLKIENKNMLGLLDQVFLLVYLIEISSKTVNVVLNMELLKIKNYRLTI